MKHFFVLLAVLVGLAVPLSAQTGQPSPRKSKARSKFQMHKVVVQAPQQSARTYYITNQTVTGSHIPVVFREYKGRKEAIDSGFRRDDVLTASDIDGTGSLDLSTALRKLEPSIF